MNRMKRELSAKLTILTKIILPGFYIFMMSLITLMMFLGMDGGSQPPPKFTFLAMLIAVTVFFYFTVMKFQKVSVDERFLYVSNFLKEIEIPLSEISDVTEIVWIRGHPVTIHLETPTAFGRKITFMPNSQGFKFFRPHPVVAELKALAKSSMSGGLGR